MEHSSEQEFLALIINYPSFIERTYVKEEYFNDKNKLMFSIITKEFELNKTLVLENLNKYNNFDLEYYIWLLENNLYSSSKDNAFIQLQKNIIDNYKKNASTKLIEEYKNDYETLLAKLNSACVGFWTLK